MLWSQLLQKVQICRMTKLQRLLRKQCKKKRKRLNQLQLKARMTQLKRLLRKRWKKRQRLFLLQLENQLGNQLFHRHLQYQQQLHQLLQLSLLLSHLQLQQEPTLHLLHHQHNLLHSLSQLPNPSLHLKLPHQQLLLFPNPSPHQRPLPQLPLATLLSQLTQRYKPNTKKVETREPQLSQGSLKRSYTKMTSHPLSSDQ